MVVEDALVRELERGKRLGVDLGPRSFDLGGADPDAGRPEIEPVEALR